MYKIRVRVLFGAWTGLLGYVFTNKPGQREWPSSAYVDGVSVRVGSRTAIFYPGELLIL